VEGGVTIADLAWEGVAHIEDTVARGRALVLYTTRVGAVVRLEHRPAQTVPVHAIGAGRVVNVANPIQALGAVVYVKQRVVYPTNGLKMLKHSHSDSDELSHRVT
jgi:hypothetical protein